PTIIRPGKGLSPKNSWTLWAEPKPSGKLPVVVPGPRISEDFWNKASFLHRRVVVVPALVRSRGDLDFFTRQFFVRNQRQQMRNAVQSCALLVIRSYDVPGRMFRIRGLQHPIACAGVVVPPFA